MIIKYKVIIMQSKKKSKWSLRLPRWKRQKKTPKRLERLVSPLGRTCILAIYQTLFPEIIANDGLTTVEQIRASNCFENGAFVFEDSPNITRLSLFNILLGNANNPPDRQLGILQGGTRYLSTTRTPLSHLMPNLLKQQGSLNQWQKVEFIFYGPYL